HGQHAVTEGSLHLTRVDRERQRERSLELPEPSLLPVVIRVLDVGPLLLTLDREDVVRDGEPDVLVGQAGQLHGNHGLVLRLVHVRRWGPDPLARAEQPVHLRLDVSQVTGQVLSERTESNSHHGSPPWLPGSLPRPGSESIRLIYDEP